MGYPLASGSQARTPNLLCRITCQVLVANTPCKRVRLTRVLGTSATDGAAQPFELPALIGPGRHLGMQREPGRLAHRITERLIAGGQRLQREHLAALLRAHSNPVKRDERSDT